MVHRLRLQTRRVLPIVTCPYRQRVPPTSIAGSHLLLGLERRREPVKAFIEPIAGRGASGLNVPLSAAERVEAESLSHLGGAHGVWQILLVGKDQNDRLPQLVFVQHFV